MEDYEHAVNVFRVFGCESMLDFCEKYCELDVLLLCIAFCQFRNEVQEEFDLDAAHFISLPGLAFQGIILINRACHTLCLNHILQAC